MLGVSEAEVVVEELAPRVMEAVGEAEIVELAEGGIKRSVGVTLGVRLANTAELSGVGVGEGVEEAVPVEEGKVDVVGEEVSLVLGGGLLSEISAEAPVFDELGDPGVPGVQVCVELSVERTERGEGEAAVRVGVGVAVGVGEGESDGVQEADRVVVCVSVTEGVLDGRVDGVEVMEEVGLEVGVPEGEVVGEPVGELERVGVGVAEGEGEEVRLGVGLVEGVLEREPVGEPVGELERLGVGEDEGGGELESQT